jgi:hypothetical protein
MARGQRRSSLAIWVVGAVAGWATIGWLAVQLFTDQPRRAAFDLGLLLGAGRAVAAGGSPYDPAIIAGHAPRAVDLFFSYPPIVGQAMVPLAGLPLGLVYLAWSVAAIALFAVVTLRLRTVIGSSTRTATLATASIALAAATLPFTIAILFGNLDAFFPALYGLALVAALSGRRRDSIAGGFAIAVAAATKLYPAGLGLWFAIRALRDRGTDRGGSALVTLVAAIGAGLVIVGISVAAFGLAPWQDYAALAATAARADLVDGRNVAPAAQLALWLGADSGLARLLHLAIVAAAVAVIAGAAWFRRDPVESLAWAATATLLLLPIGWIHYPAALMPFVAAAALRADALDAAAARRVRLLTVAAILAAAAALTWLPLLWLATVLGLLAVNQSVPAATPDAVERTARAGGSTVAQGAAR